VVERPRSASSTSRPARAGVMYKRPRARNLLGSVSFPAQRRRAIPESPMLPAPAPTFRQHVDSRPSAGEGQTGFREYDARWLFGLTQPT
jgi:hypothetical protein